MFKQVQPIRVVGDIAYVPLTQGYEAVIDVEDVSLVAGHNWSALRNRHIVYASRGAKKHENLKSTVYLHRVVARAAEGDVVDHISRDGLDNRKANLRVCVNAENCRNQKLAANNTSGFKGVSWNKARGYWTASIRTNGKQRYLGRFADREVAAAAYAAASARLHGDFGRVS